VFAITLPPGAKRSAERTDRGTALGVLSHVTGAKSRTEPGAAP
jgi:hypothetical protein